MESQEVQTLFGVSLSFGIVPTTRMIPWTRYAAAWWLQGADARRLAPIVALIWLADGGLGSLLIGRGNCRWSLGIGALAMGNLLAAARET